LDIWQQLSSHLIKKTLPTIFHASAPWPLKLRYDALEAR